MCLGRCSMAYKLHGRDSFSNNTSTYTVSLQQCFDSFVDFWLYMLRLWFLRCFVVLAFTAVFGIGAPHLAVWSQTYIAGGLFTSNRSSNPEYPHPSLVHPRGSDHLSDLRRDSHVSGAHLTQVPFLSLMLWDIPQPPALLICVDGSSSITQKKGSWTYFSHANDWLP